MGTLAGRDESNKNQDGRSTRDKVLSWIESEPVITRVGSVGGLIVGFLFVRGLIARDTYDLAIAVSTLLLGTGGIAGARAAVTPTIKLLQPKKPDAPIDGHGA
jgi:hypothetical protein